MIYKKPNNVSYTDMCIYIDEHLYSDARNDDKIFEYLYHVLKMLAIQNCMCSTQQEYEDFAIYSASKLFTRLTNKKTDAPVKSILNYCKATIDFLRVDFEYFEGRVQPDAQKAFTEHNFNFEYILGKRLDALDTVEFRIMLSNIPSMVKFHMKNLPFIPNTQEYLNVYTSIVLTLLNRLTFSKKARKRLDKLSEADRLRDRELRQLFHREKYTKTVLFHLPDSMEAYIDVVTRQVLHSLAKELSEALATHVDSDVESIAVAASDYNRSVNYVDKD